ncbi:MAG: NYN domain-containing protein [Magnetococcus sp. YQC-5]
MARVIAYIDGFNLYFGLRSKGWRKFYWLDLVELSRSLLKPGQELQTVHYFTARIRTNGHNNEDLRRQNTYLEALGTQTDLHLHFGHYLEKKRECRQCGAQWLDYEEKMTDVNIAVQLLDDACEDRFDTALIVSGDSDLTAPLNLVRSRYSTKRVVVALPPGRHSVQLTRSAGGYFTIGEDKLRQSQLPETIIRADGFILARPAHWR